MKEDIQFVLKYFKLGSDFIEKNIVTELNCLNYSLIITPINRQIKDNTHFVSKYIKPNSYFYSKTLEFRSV